MNQICIYRVCTWELLHCIEHKDHMMDELVDDSLEQNKYCVSFCVSAGCSCILAYIDNDTMYHYNIIFALSFFRQYLQRQISLQCAISSGHVLLENALQDGYRKRYHQIGTQECRKELNLAQECATAFGFVPIVRFISRYFVFRCSCILL